ncbi:hypothetical protein [Nostoc sp.]|uniref:hypothetical protein n=1 Tax=Nostoc sp. TaxID=1180 RepID=UPI002FF9E1FF
MRVGNRPHNSTQLLETLFAFVTKLNYELRSRSVPEALLRITNYFNCHCDRNVVECAIAMTNIFLQNWDARFY